MASDPIAALLAAALSGCAPLGPAPPAAGFEPLSPESLGATVRARQILTFSRDGRSLTLQCHVEVTPASTSVVGATALGHRMLSFVHDAQGLRPAADVPAEAPPAARVLADLQLAAWPLAALREAAAAVGQRVEEPRPGTRQLWRGGRLVAEIHYAAAAGRDGPAWQGRWWLVNLEQGYTLDVESTVIE